MPQSASGHSRHGDLAVNLLAEQIKRSNILKDVKVSKDIEVRISQYADDTVLFLENSSQNLQGALHRGIKQIFKILRITFEYRKKHLACKLELIIQSIMEKVKELSG